jgi:hypothetical protein
MTGPPALDSQSAPPTKRAKPDGIPVRLYDGSLVAHADPELEERLVSSGAAEAFRNGPRRYLRLRWGVQIPRGTNGWDIIEVLRKYHGDKKTAAYVAHKDSQSEYLCYQRSESGAESRQRTLPESR